MPRKQIQVHCKKNCPKKSNCAMLPAELHCDEGQNPEIYFVADAPNQDEARQRTPFAGPSGELLRSILTRTRFSRPYALDYLCRFCPKDASGVGRAPTAIEITNCAEFLLNNIERFNPKIIVAMGSTVFQYLAKTDAKISKSRGRLLDVTIRGKTYKLLPTYSPSHAQRNPSIIGTLRKDIESLSNDTVFSIPKGKHILFKTVNEITGYIDFIMNDLTKNDFVALDYETLNLGRCHTNKPLTVQLSHNGKTGFVIPLAHRQTPFDPSELTTIYRALRKLYRKPVSFQGFVGHNIKFEQVVSIQCFKTPIINKPFYCTQAGAFLLDENKLALDKEFRDEQGIYSLEVVAREQNFHGYKDSLKHDRAHLNDYKLDAVAEYGGMDAWVNWHVFMNQRVMAKQQKYEKQWLTMLEHWYSSAWRLFAHIEHNGFLINMDQLRFLNSKGSPIFGRLNEIKEEFNQLPSVKEANDILFEKDSGGRRALFSKPWLFDIDKPRSKQVLFFDVLELEPLTKGKDGSGSIDKKFKEHYVETIKEVALLSELEKTKKLHQSYVKPMSTRLHPKSGEEDAIDERIRGNYGITNTLTGRASCNSPNLQQIPKADNAAKKSIKDLFCVPKGKALVQVDHKTSEVKWLALMSGDLGLIKNFKIARTHVDNYRSDPSNKILLEKMKAYDFHRLTASLMFNIRPEDVTKGQRQAAKCVVGSTKLFTNKGIISIESLVENKADDVWLQKLNNVTVSSNDTPVDAVLVNHKWVDSTILVESAFGEIQGDADHPLLVWENCQLVEKKLKNIKEGDLLVYPRNNNLWPEVSPSIETRIENIENTDVAKTVTCVICGHTCGNLTTHIRGNHNSTSSYMQKYPDAPIVAPAVIAKRLNTLLDTEYNPNISKYPTQMTTDLASVLGYLVAEGCGQLYSMSGHAEKSAEMLADFIHNINICFGLQTSVSEYPHLTTTGVVRLPRKIVTYLLACGLIKGYSNTQRVPAILFRSTRAEVISFLRSYFEGDGSVKDNCIVAMSASKLLMQDIQLLLLNLNIHATLFSELRITPVGKETRRYYGLSMAMRDAIIFRDTVGFRSERKQKEAQSLRFKYARDYIYGLETLLASLRQRYKVGCATSKRCTLAGHSVRFGERITKGLQSEITHERLASRPYVLDALRLWSEVEKNNVYRDVKWLHENKATLKPVLKRTIINERIKVYDIEVNHPSHTFVANGLLSKNCISFGIMYGKTAPSLAVDLNIDRKEAEKLIAVFFKAYPLAESWLMETERVASTRGYVTTPMGRRRRLLDAYLSKDDKLMHHANNQARNSPIQGISSDVAIIGGTLFQDYITDNKLVDWKIVAFVHDSVVWEVPFCDVIESITVAEDLMTTGAQKYVKDYFDYDMLLPLDLEFEIGKTLGSLKAWDFSKEHLEEILESVKNA